MYLKKKIVKSCFFCSFQQLARTTLIYHKMINEKGNIRFYNINRETEGNMTKSRDLKEVIKKARANPHLYRDGFKVLLKESRKFYEEQKYKLSYRKPFHYIRDGETIDIAFKFETPQDLALFTVTTDRDNQCGFSTASLKLTGNQTALFSGNISTEIPKGSKVENAGFANFTCLRKCKSFYRPSYYDWSYYTHLVLKVRGDGRPWLIILGTPFGYKETYSYQFCHPLYTRGGPYWQLTKIPFSYFFFSNENIISQKNEVVPLDKIGRIGFTLADNRDGPFKLEIDYIGLENSYQRTSTSPYENYYETIAFF